MESGQRFSKEPDLGCTVSKIFSRRQSRRDNLKSSAQCLRLAWGCLAWRMQR